MKIRRLYRASEKMVSTFGSQTQARSKDLSALIRRGDQTAVAVIDAAENFLGKTHFLFPAISKKRGLPDTTLLNGGEIASSVIKMVVESELLTGAPLIGELNRVLRSVQTALEVRPSSKEREKLFTAYIGHVIVGRDFTTITSVGDCFVSVNGEIIAGEFKAIDLLNQGVVKRAAKFMGLSHQESYQLLMPRLNTWQFRYQNQPERALWYPAIDGTETPIQGISQISLPTSQVESILLWTDGFEPKAEPIDRVDYLEAVDKQYGERLAIEVSEIQNPYRFVYENL